MMYNRDALIEGFKSIIPELNSYLIKNRLTIDARQLKGEFYTRIRRHLPELTNPSSNPLTVNNIDTISFDISTGELHYISFLKSFGGCYDQNKIDMLNDILEELDFDFKQLILEDNVNCLLKEVENYKF